MAKKNPHERFFNLLVKRDNPWIEWPVDATSWKTYSKGKLKPSRLKKGHPIGIYPDKNQTNFLCIDIDSKSSGASRYHPSSDPDAIDKIKALLAINGVEQCLLIQSSGSKGIHLWAPIPDTHTFELAIWLETMFTDAGYLVQPGTLELFPNVPCKGSDFKPIRLPLVASGSWMLNDDLDPTHQNMNTFCNAWEHARECNSNLRLPDLSSHHSGYYRRIAQAKSRLSKGFTGPHQTFKLASSAGYLAASEGLSGCSLRSRMCSLLKSAPNCQRYSNHWDEISRGTYNPWWRYYSGIAGMGIRTQNRPQQRASQQAESHKRNPRFNDQKAADALRRIINIAAKLSQDGKTFRNITEARQAMIKLAKLQGETLSINTIIKHNHIALSLLAQSAGEQRGKLPEPHCAAKEFRHSPQYRV